jgi:hypothetical protein
VKDADAYAEWLHNQQANYYYPKALEQEQANRERENDASFGTLLNRLLWQPAADIPKNIRTYRDANAEIKAETADQRAEQKRIRDEIKAVRKEMRDYDLTEGLSNPKTLENTQVDMAAVYARLAELEEREKALIAELNEAGGKTFGQRVTDYGDMISNRLQDPLATIDILGYNVDTALGLTDPNDEQAWQNAHAFQQGIQEESERLKQGHGKFGQELLDATGAAASMLGNVAMWTATGIPQAAEQVLGSVAANLMNQPERLGMSALEKAGANAKWFAGNAIQDFVASQGNVAISTSSAIQTYDRAKTSGATNAQAFAAGLMAGAAEYYSNKMFSGTPFEDNPQQAGYVTELIENVASKLGKSAEDKVGKFFGNNVVNYIFDKSGEGWEEVITGYLDPLIARLTYDPDADLATAQELWEEWVGGVLMSTVMGISEPITDFYGQKIAAREYKKAQDARMSAYFAALESGLRGESFEDFKKANDVSGLDEAELQKIHQNGTLYSDANNTKVQDLVNVAAATMGEQGVKQATNFRSRVNDTVAADYFNEASKIYEAGKSGKQFIKDLGILTEEEARSWYDAGRADAVLEENNEQSGNESEGRVDRLDSAGQAVAMEEGAERAVAGRQTVGESTGGARAADAAQRISEQQAAAKKLAADETLTSSAEIGISTGTDYRTIREISDKHRDQWTPQMNEVAHMAEENGVKVRFYTGRMALDDGSGVFFVRGLNEGDGSTIWIRADADEDIVKIARHELFHTAEKRDANLDDDVRMRIVKDHGAEALQAMVQKYADKYRGSGMSDEEILREIYADAYAGIDVFEGITEKGEKTRAPQFNPQVTEGVRASRQGAVDQKRSVTMASVELTDKAGRSEDRESVIARAAREEANELETKSPFYDGFVEHLRSSTEKNVQIVSVRTTDDVKNAKFGRLRDLVRNNNKLFRGKVENNETSYEIVVGRPGLEETATNAEYRKDITPVVALTSIKDLLQNAILIGNAPTDIDENLPLKGKNSPTRLYQNLYAAPFTVDGKGAYMAIMRVDVLDNNLTDTLNKFYNLNSVEIAEASGNEDFIAAFRAESSKPSASMVSIADIAANVNPEYIGNHVDISLAEDNNGNMASRENDTRLQRENIELQKRLDEALADTKLSRGWRAAQKDVARVAADMIEATSSKESQAMVEQKIRSLVEAASNGGITSAEMKDLALDIARGLIRRSSVLTTKDFTSYDEMRKYLKREYIQVPVSLRREFTDWKAFAAAHKAMRMRTDGLGIGAVYSDLQKRMGDTYFPDLTGDMDKLLQIAEVLDDLTPVYDNPYSVNMAEATEETANAILDAILDIGQAAPTYADRAKAREGDVRALYQNKLAEQKTYFQQRIQDEANRRADQTEALRQHYAEVRKAASARRADSASRARLLRIAKRLQNAKLPAVSRAWVNEHIGDLDTVAVGITGRTLDRLSDLQKWYDNQRENNPDFIADAVTEERLKRLASRHISDMTPEEVLELTNVLLNFENAVRTQRQLIDDEDRRDTRAMAEETVNNVRTSPGTKKTVLDALVTNTLSPARLIRRITGYAETDPLYHLTQGLEAGQRAAMDYQMRAERLFSKWTNDEKLMKQLTTDDTITITGYSRGKPVSVRITPDMRMALYLHSLNDQNMKHIANGGITIPDIDLYRKGDLEEAYSRGTTIKLSPSAVRGLITKMSAAERAFARQAHDYFNGMSRNEINDVSEKLVAGVEDYFPIETDRNFTKADVGELKRDGTIAGMGFLKERINAANAINLVPLTYVLNKSIRNHAKYVGLAIPVRNFSKVWGMSVYDQATEDADGLRAAVNNRWGARAVNYVEKMVADLQNKKVDRDDFAKLLDKVRSNYAGAVLSLNASVAMKQAASYPTAAAVLGWGPLAKAMKDVGRVDLALIAKYTPLQWYRSQGYSSQELGDIATRGGLMDKAMKAKVEIGDYGVPVLNWIQGVDLLTTRKLWKASEYYVQENQKDLRAGTDEYYQAVAKIYNKVIEETQPNYTVMQRPQLLRTNNSLLQSITMFKTQPFQNFNVLYDAIGELRAAERMAKNGDSSKLAQAKKNAFNAVTSQLAQLAVFASMTAAWALLRRRREKYEDENGNLTPWCVAAGIGKDMISGAASMIPFGSDVYNLINSALTGDKYYGTSSVTISAISDSATALLKGFNAVKDTIGSLMEGEDVDAKKLALDLNTTAQEIAKALGLPLENVENIAEIVFSNAAVATAGPYVGGYMVLRYTKNLNSTYVKGDAYDLLYKAYKNDRTQYMRLRDLMREDGFKDSNMDAAIKKREKK